MPSDLKISATEDTVNSVLSRNIRFKVPEYQREYAWKEKQWEEFWSDLMQVAEGDQTHFLGSIVVVKKDQGLDELSILEIVDGQQRLVTISILLCIIRQRLKATSSIPDDEPNPADQIDSKYLWVIDENLQKFPNIRLSTFDDDEYQELLNGRLPEEDSQLVDSAEFFFDKTEGMSTEEIDNLRRRLVDSMSLVTIDCNNESSAFRLFETLNDRGLELSAIDLMKNYLFGRATEDKDINYELVRDDWQKIARNIKPELTKPSRFFRHYIMSAPLPDVTTPISQYTLYRRFCDIIDQDVPSSEISVEDYIQDMAETSALYVDIVDESTAIFDKRANKKLNRKLEELNTLGVTQERTLLLRLFDEIENPNQLLRSLRILESFVFRRRVAGGRTGTDIDELYANLCSTIFNDSDPIERLKERLEALAPDDAQVRLSIITEGFPRNARTRYILSKIENDYYNNSKSDVADATAIEVEHIAPRKSFSAKKYSTWPTYLNISPEEFDEYSNSLGNLTILDERMNARAQDNPFDQKKREYESSDYKMTKSICEFDRWSIDSIEQRTEMLANIAPRIWNFDI